MKLRTKFARAASAVIESLESRRLMSSISGIVFSDTNLDGVVNTGDTLLASRKIFLDLDKDGVKDGTEPDAISNASGVYTFSGLSAGTYRVRRADLPGGYKYSTPTSGFVDVTLSSGQDVDSINFGAILSSSTVTSGVGSISGIAFSDSNQNGVLETSDTLLANRTMFIDLDKDGVKDSTEATAVTNASGKYTFANLAPGSYRVRRGDTPAGYTFSTPSSGFYDLTVAGGQNLTSNNFGAILISSTGSGGGTTAGTGATYYVSSTGSDSAAGTSLGTAWKSITRVNSQKLKAGDQILFEGGKSFSGSLYIPSAEGGTSDNPVNFSTYGSGRATINSGSSSGIDIAQTAGILISNLNFVGNGMNSNSSVGIWVHVDFTSKTLSTLNVKNVDVSGYGCEGMRIMVAGSGSTLSNVKVEYVDFHDNLYGGLKVTGASQKSNKNYIVDHVRAWNSPGSKSTGDVTGSGIYIADVDGAKISRSSAWNNGKDGAAPVGIWAAGSNRVTIEYCESYNNRTATASDGGGFDFDWDTSNSTIQYCYSHNNDGPGYLMAAGDHGNSGNVFRYNVSENDGRRNGRAGIQLWGNVTTASIYNNVVYIAATGNTNTTAFYAHDIESNGKRPQNVQVRNNIFYTTGGAKIVHLTSGVVSYGSLTFNGNAYHTSSGTFNIQWGGSSYSSLSVWQSATGQEKMNGVATGYQGDPKLTAVGLGGTIGNADTLLTLSAYKLLGSSPLVNSGVAQPTFLASAVTDFYGDSLPKGGKYDIGIDEVA